MRSTRWTLPAALVGVLLLAGCAGGGPAGAGSTVPTVRATPTATKSAPPTPGETANPTTTSQPSASSSPTTPGTPAATPLENATSACTHWQASLGQDASTYPATQAAAAALAQTAATADPQWQTLASDMASLVALVGDTSDSGVAQGQELFTDLSTQCGTIGVTVSAG